MKGLTKLKCLRKIYLLCYVCCILNSDRVFANDSLPLPNVNYIDPTIGNVGLMLEPTRPTVQLPNQLIRFTPQREDYLDDQISSFPLTIVSHRLGQVFSIKPANQLTPDGWQNKMPYDHDLEVNRPWYYSTYLINDDITVEFAPAAKAACYRFSFPANAEPALLLGTYNDGEAQFHFSDSSISGFETYHGDIKIYMYGRFSQRGQTGVANNGQLQNSDGISGKNIQAYIRFAKGTKTIYFTYAISFVSAEQAVKNYENEAAGKSFETIKGAARQTWTKAMAQIEVTGGTEKQRKAFYTALYRSSERMINASEDGSYYSGFDKQVHTGQQRMFYEDDWSWDTYLALHPLRMVLHPKQEEDMLQSYVSMYEQGDWMPSFPVIFGDYACMNGFHSSVIFLDAYRKGLTRFDVEKAYEGIKKNSLAATLLPWRNGPATSLDTFYRQNGYMPALHPGEKETMPEVHPFEKRQAVAVTLGASYDDWAAGQLASDLHKYADTALLMERSNNYKNLWNAEKQLFLPKDDKGNWIAINPKFDGGPGGRDYYDENNGWTYLWQVQYNIPALVKMMGGKDAFEKKLDQLFRERLDMARYTFWNTFPDASGLVGQYSMGNEPSFHIPYLYNFTNAPWKTQKAIRLLLKTWFRDDIFSIPGDEDGGGMSAFVVFSSMGFYPVSPGKPIYTIGSPLFEKIVIHLENGKDFTVIANHCSEVNKYIQSATMNGKVLTTPWFTHEQLVNGGILKLEMGPKPNKEWGN